MVGTTRSFGAGGLDIWAVRTNTDGTLLGDCTGGMEVNDTTATVRTTKAITADLDVAFANADGSVKDTSATVKDSNATVEVQCSATEIPG